MDGYKVSELASLLGRQPSWVSQKLADARAEIHLQSAVFPFVLTEQEYESLRGDIELHGIQMPVIIGEHVSLIDGRHRWRIAEELGMEAIPAVFLNGMTEKDERELMISLNCARRQLSQEQKSLLVRNELMRDRARSDRSIAAICGVAPRTVGRYRFQIEELEAVQPSPEQVREQERALEERYATPEQPRVELRTRSDGKIIAIKRPDPLQAKPARFISRLTCPCCLVEVGLYLHPTGAHTLEALED